MREHPWQARRTVFEYDRWLNQLTTLSPVFGAWLREFGAHISPTPSSPLPPKVTKEAAERALALFEGLLKEHLALEKKLRPATEAPSMLDFPWEDWLRTPSRLSFTFWDARFPEETLREYEASLLELKSQLLESCLELELQPSELFRKVTWELGRKQGDSDWNNHNTPLITQQRYNFQYDLRDCWDACRNNPWFSLPSLVRPVPLRVVTSEVRLRLNPAPSEPLVELAAIWLQGYLYALNPRAEQFWHRRTNPAGISHFEIQWKLG
jgi:hypothetical protein